MYYLLKVIWNNCCYLFCIKYTSTAVRT